MKPAIVYDYSGLCIAGVTVKLEIPIHMPQEQFTFTLCSILQLFSHNVCVTFDSYMRDAWICVISRVYLCCMAKTLELEFCLWSQGQWKAKPPGFIFSHTSFLMKMKFEVDVEVIRLNILILL